MAAGVGGPTPIRPIPGGGRGQGSIATFGTAHRLGRRSLGPSLVQLPDELEETHGQFGQEGRAAPGHHWTFLRVRRGGHDGRRPMSQQVSLRDTGTGLPPFPLLRRPASPLRQRGGGKG